MKKFLIWVLVLGSVSFYALTSMQHRLDARAQTNPTEYQTYTTPTWIPTRAPIPTATIGYEATVAVAQMTADEARRVNAEVTSQAEGRILEYARLTAVVEDHNYQIASWTQQAAATSIPLTATAAVINTTQLAESQRIVAAGYTQQAVMPTQQAAMLQLQATAQFARVNEIVKIIAIVLTCVFLLAGIAFFVRMAPKEETEELDAPIETVLHIRKETGQGGFTQTRFVVPCTTEQLTELAEMSVNGEKKFGINRLETHSRTFKSQRDTLLKVRDFLLSNRLVIPDANGTITLNADGENFLAAWFDDHRLPDEYVFTEQNAPTDENQVVDGEFVSLV